MYKYYFAIAILVAIIGVVSIIKSEKDNEQELPKKRERHPSER